MANPTDLNCDEVIKFLESKEGTTTNLELVSHFRKFLNDPLHQVEMRLRFKDIINSIANVHEYQGTKCISLKDKCLSYDSHDNKSLPQETNVRKQSSVKKSEDSQANAAYQPYWRYRLSCSGKPTAPSPALSNHSPELSDYHRRSSYPQILTTENSSHYLVSQQSFPPPSRVNACDKRRAGVFDSLYLDEDENQSPVYNDSVFDANISITHQDSFVKEVGESPSFQHSGRTHPQLDPSPSSTGINCTSELQNPAENHILNRCQDIPISREQPTLADVKDSMVSLPCRETLGKPEICMTDDKVQSKEPNVSSKQEQPAASVEEQLPEEEYRAHSTSVRERAEQIERMSALEAPRRSSPHHKYRDFGYRARNEKISDDDTSVVSTLDSKLRRQWFVKAAQCDYHGLLSLLKTEPRLAGLRDFTSGFTALHWAAKHGNAELVKLIAGSHKVSPDLRSHGGYTCIHLATLYKHKPIVELLVKTYGADPTIRDNSGKRADQYPSDYLSISAGSNRHTICNRHYSKADSPTSVTFSPKQDRRIKRRKTILETFRKKNQREEEQIRPPSPAPFVYQIISLDHAIEMMRK